MAYICPFATRMVQHRYIMCKALMKEGVNYADIMNASKVFCPYQYYCRMTGRTENTDRGQDCYSRRAEEMKNNSV